MSVQRFSGSNLASSGALCRPPRANGAGLRRFLNHFAVLFVLIALGWMLSGCTQNEYERALELSRDEEAETRAISLESVPEELLKLSFSEVIQGAGYEHLGAARLFRDADLFEFLSGYLVNIPPGAEFLSDRELDVAWSENRRLERTDETVPAAIADFRHRVLLGAYGASSELWQDYLEQLRSEAEDAVRGETDQPVKLRALQAAFFEALEQCGQDSPWPDAELFVMGDGYAGDFLPDFIEQNSDISAFEYRELLHVCGRYAATYPTLSQDKRDELLAPQRARYAHSILDLLDNLQPTVNVPPEYRDEVEDLRRNGW